MIVVDATVLVDFLVGEEILMQAARKLAFEDPDWISVGLWRYEVGNALLSLARFGKPKERGMGEVLQDADVLLIDTVHDLTAREIWSVATESGLSYYDASYVWLAYKRGLILRTRDKKVLKKFPDLARAMPT